MAEVNGRMVSICHTSARIPARAVAGAFAQLVRHCYCQAIRN